MRTKNIIITIAALMTGILVSSCAKKSDFDSYRETTDSRFGTVEEQAAYLNGVMETIGAEQELLGTFLDTLQTASDSFASEVDSLMDDLDGRMKAVQDSLHGYTKKTELEATFATLASVDTLSGVLAAIEVKLKSDSLVLTAALKNSIKATEASLTEKFKSYYKKGELDALLAAQSRRMDTLSANADSAAKEIKIIRESIAELQKRYAGISSTLDNRIKELKETDDEIEGKIKILDNAISTELKSLKSEVAGYAADITALEARVRKLEIRVQSIEVVPDYADGSVDMIKGDTKINFEVRPRYLIDSLAGKPGLFSFQIIKTAAATKAGIFTDTITVKSVAKSVEDSLLIVTIDGKEMPADFFAGTQTYSARLSLSDGNTDRTSAYFPLTPPPPPVFSVSADKKVIFSPGNLQYQASTGTWRFAEHQYDYIGNAAGNNIEKGRDTQSAWIDLFGWGATGQNTFGQPPYSINDDAAFYKTVETASGSETLTIANKADWGCCIGGETNWRTLSCAEWTYLLSASGRGTGDSYFKWGVTVAGKEKCLVIAPDGYSGKIQASYDAAAWSAAEADGLVCFPAAGYRDGYNVNEAGDAGYYWSSTADSEFSAYRMDFSNKVYTGEGHARSCGLSVRLVTDVK